MLTLALTHTHRPVWTGRSEGWENRWALRLRDLTGVRLALNSPHLTFCMTLSIYLQIVPIWKEPLLTSPICRSKWSCNISEEFSGHCPEFSPSFRPQEGSGIKPSAWRGMVVLGTVFSVSSKGTKGAGNSLHCPKGS